MAEPHEHNGIAGPDEVTDAERRADLEEDHEAHAGGYVNVDFDTGEVVEVDEPQVPPNADAEG